MRRMVTTDGHLLDGRLHYRQPAEGFRSGLEPVLLAAAVPAKSGQHVLEAGTGAGAALLCLLARVAGIHATGIEIDPDLAALASDNAAANGFDTIRILGAPVETVTLDRRFDHAIANPPYHAVTGTLSPSPRREAAKRAVPGLLDAWIRVLAGSLRDHGTLTLIVPPAAVPICLDAMGDHACGCRVIYPLWPKAGRAAKLVLLRGIRRGRSPMRLAAGMVLHEDNGAFTQAAHVILRETAALFIDS